ncbi:hypothetical protein SAMD00019534_112100, partial [Acytostelium subglobosum LB1]|uniref:hypothetical protein n=1 Tax=Acytostelium subglobosum LB1 TaxID=1410327 RepID=UPI00064515FE
MYNTIYYVLGGMFALIGFLALYQFIQAVRFSRSNTKQVFTATIVLVMFARGAFFLITPSIVSGSLQNFPLNVLLLWDHMIDMLFFLAYFMFFLSWTDFYYQASVGSESNFFKNRIVVIVLSSFYVGSVIAITGCFLMSNNPDTVKTVELVTACFITSLYFMTAGLFAVYGLKINRLMNDCRLLIKNVQSTKVKAITWICSLCFLLRACLIVYSIILLNNEPESKTFNLAWYWVLIFFVVLEILPTCAMLYYLSKGQQNSSSRTESTYMAIQQEE